MNKEGRLRLGILSGFNEGGFAGRSERGMRLTGEARRIGLRLSGATIAVQKLIKPANLLAIRQGRAATLRATSKRKRKGQEQGAGGRHRLPPSLWR